MTTNHLPSTPFSRASTLRMSLTVNQHYGSQSIVRNHYYGSRPYPPNPYPHGLRQQKRTWNIHTFPKPTHSVHPLAVHAPIHTPWPIQAPPPAPIIINNCACARSIPISTSIPGPGPGPAQPPATSANIQANSGATAPPRNSETQESAGPANANPLVPDAFHQSATGVRARDILPTIRPPRGPRVETPPPSPPPRRSTRHKEAYGAMRSFPGGITSERTYAADEEAPTVNWGCGSDYESMRHGAPIPEPHTRGVRVYDILPSIRSVKRPATFPASVSPSQHHSRIMVAPHLIPSFNETSRGAPEKPERAWGGGFTPNLTSSRSHYAALQSPWAPPPPNAYQSYSSPNLAYKS